MWKNTVLILVVIAAVFIYVKYIEKKAIFFPDKEIDLFPPALGLAYTQVYIDTADQKTIHGWFIPNPKAKYTLLFFHGNAGNIGNRVDKINILAGLGLNILIIDYRGYGKSKGKPSEIGCYKDAQAAYNYLLNNRKLKPEQIILYGESMGTAVAVDLADDKPIAALILEGAFSSGKDMAGIIYPFLPSFFFSDIFNSLAKIKNIKASKLIIHSKDDEIVPIALARKLFEAAIEPKRFIEINGDHNNAFLQSQEKYTRGLKSFMGEFLR